MVCSTFLFRLYTILRLYYEFANSKNPSIAISLLNKQIETDCTFKNIYNAYAGWIFVGGYCGRDFVFNILVFVCVLEG